MTEDKLEILIGKSLDGELSPGEQRVLDHELDRNHRAKELLDELRGLCGCTRELIGSQVTESGADVEDVFERAWQRRQRPSRRRVVRANGHLRFAAGLAAGLLLGATLHFVLVWGSTPADKPATPPVAVRAGSPETPLQDTPSQPTSLTDPLRITRKVDWYSFTDENGSQWLAEAVREGVAKPAAYYDDL